MMDINTGKFIRGTNAFQQSIKLILLTPKKHRVLNRDFGSEITQYLGSPINTVAMQIYGETIRSIEENSQNIKVEHVKIINSIDEYLNIEIIYNGGEKYNAKLT